MQLQKDYFLSQLLILQPTIENLKSLAIYTRTFVDNSEEIIEGLEHCRSLTTIFHRLNLYYLINEMLIVENEQNQLQILLKSFIKKNFQEDLLSSIKFENVYKRFLDLEKLWRNKKIINFDEFTLEEIISNVQKLYKNKQDLIGYLESIIKFYKNK